MMMIFPYIYWLYHKLKKSSQKQILTKSILILIVTNTIVVSVTGLIQEARLLFLPLLIAIPFLHKEIEDSLISFGNMLKRGKFISILISLTLSSLIAFLWYENDLVNIGWMHKAYIFIYFYLLIYLLIDDYLQKKIVITDD